jgi:hypothetical protein
MPRKMTVDPALREKYDALSAEARELANMIKSMRHMKLGPAHRYVHRRNLLAGMEALIAELRATP